MQGTGKLPRWAAWLALLAVTVAGVWLRLHGISDKSFWTDEGISAAFTKLGWYDFIRILWRREGNMALYYILLRSWSQFGDSEAWLRAFSALWSVATIPALYLLGKRMFGDWTGVAAAMLWSVNAYAVRYAQEARSYSMVAFLVTVATYFLVTALKDGRKRDWTSYILFSVLAVYAHFFAVLIVLTHVVALWRSHRAHLISASKWIALFTIPVWIFIATTGTGPINWIPRPNLHGMWIIFNDYVGHGGLALTLLYLLGMVVFGTAAWRSPVRQPYTLVFAWFLLPIAITFLISLAKPLLIPRYLIISLPALVLVVAAGLASLPWRWLAASALGITCWFAMTGLRGYYMHDFDLAREDFRSATAYVLANTAPGDSIVFHKGQNRFPYAYYADHSGVQTKPAIIYPGSSDPTWRDFATKVTPQTLSNIVQQNGRVWLMISQNMGPNGEDAVARELKHAAAENRSLIDARDFAMLRVYRYSLRK